MEIILASGSPRRRELLGLCCPDFRVEVSGADERVDEVLSPEELVARLAEKKAAEVAGPLPGGGGDRLGYGGGAGRGDPRQAA